MVTRLVRPPVNFNQVRGKKRLLPIISDTWLIPGFPVLCYAIYWVLPHRVSDIMRSLEKIDIDSYGDPDALKKNFDK